MSVAAIVELSQELHRLAVAGVGLARNDRRVAALLPALEKSGAKVPVFARIAERTSALLAASKSEAPGELLQLNTLVGAVLKTQGKAGVDSELEPPPPSVTTPKRIPMRALNDLREGLYGGRSRTLDDAIERGWFGDARLASFALDALASDDAALANLAAEKLVPPYGRGIVPALVASLDLTAKRPAARIIETVGRVDADSGAALARQILDPAAERVFPVAVDGRGVSDEATVAALGLLGDGAADRGLLADALAAKRKPIRLAALSALLALGDTEAEARAIAMLGGATAKSREAIEAIPALTGAAMAAPAVARAQELAKALAADKPTTADVNDALRVLSLLVRSEADPARFEVAFALFERLGGAWRTASGFGAGETRALLDYLVGNCTDAARKPLARRALRVEPLATTLAAIRRLGPDDALSFLTLAKASDFRRGLRSVFPSDPDGWMHREPDLPPPTDWNVEWLELGFRHDLSDIVDYLWPVDPGRVVERLLAKRRLYGDDALRALVADPRCAASVRPKLATDGDGLGCFARLCEAIEADDRERALELVGAVPDDYRSELRIALRDRLVAHFTGASA